MSKNQKKGNLENFTLRKSAIELFLKKRKFNSRAKIVKIDNLFGTTLIDKTIDSILVTRSTASGAKKINAERVKKGLHPLTIILTTYARGTDNRRISSTRIRTGEIDRNGFNFFHFLNSKREFFLPNNLRGQLSEPLGEIFSDTFAIQQATNVASEKVIVVGDQTAANFLSLGKKPLLSIVDFKVQRLAAYKSLADLGFGKEEKIITVKNVAGSISSQLSRTIYKCLKNKKIIRVIKVLGEEDLAVIPCILLAPIGFYVFYGLREKGLIKVSVNSITKNLMLEILYKFN